MEFAYDIASLKLEAGTNGLRVQDEQSFSLILIGKVSTDNTETTYNILHSVSFCLIE
jgi:hypothetical protein